MEQDTVKFKVYCVEEYRRAHGLTAPQTVDLFERYGVFGFLDEPALRWQSLSTPSWTSTSTSKREHKMRTLR